MSDFVDDDDIANAPVDDIEAFVHYARRASDKFNDRTEQWEGNQDYSEDLNDARIALHSYILGIAHAYDVAEFAKMGGLNANAYGRNEWRSFKAQYDFLMTKLMHDRARATRADGFLLTETAKEGIRTHIAGLRKYITEGQLPEKTKKKLLAKVDEFETALHKRQMSMTVVYAFAGFVMGSLADATTIADSTVVHKLLNNVFHVASAEVAKTEEVARLIAPKSPLQITHDKPGPSPARTQPKPPLARGPRESFSADLDDEIPF
jgi:hypothetical protein